MCETLLLYRLLQGRHDVSDVALVPMRLLGDNSSAKKRLSLA